MSKQQMTVTIDMDRVGTQKLPVYLHMDGKIELSHYKHNSSEHQERVDSLILADNIQSAIETEIEEFAEEVSK